MSKKDVIGFGALNIDLVCEGPIAEEGERVLPSHFLEPTLESLTGPVLRSGGGSAANTVYALSEMGFSTGYIGRVGRDGKFLKDLMGRVDRRGVAEGEGMSGYVISRQYQGKRSMAIFPGENDTLDESDIDLGYASDSQFIHMTSFVGDRPFKAQGYVACNVPGDVKISLDPGMLYAKARGVVGLFPLLARSYALFANEEELWHLAHRTTVKGCCEYLLRVGPEIVACKLGKDGSYVMSKNGNYFEAKGIEVPEHEQLYPTGTGDAYDAGFLAGLLLGKDVDECAMYGNMLGAMKLRVPREDFHPTLDYLIRR